MMIVEIVWSEKTFCFLLSVSQRKLLHDTEEMSTSLKYYLKVNCKIFQFVSFGIDIRTKIPDTPKPTVFVLIVKPDFEIINEFVYLV